MSTPNTKTPPTSSSLSPNTRGIKRKFLWFTLVELIVVITILVILGTIAFLNLWGFSGSARDSARISNLANLQKGLNVYQVRTWTYPMPESSVAITASWTPIGYQWFAKDIVWGIAKISKGWTVDPSDTSIYTTYAVNSTLTKMQAMVFLEDSGNVTAFNLPLPLGEGWGEGFIAYAATTTDYSKRFPKTSGDTLGILLSTATGTLNQPVQESGTGVDVVLTNTGYLAVFSKGDSIIWSGSKLVAMKASMANVLSIPLRDTSLVGYWDMETTTSDGKLADLSGNGNNGTGRGGLVIWGGEGNGKKGRNTKFDGLGENITWIATNQSILSFSNNFSFSVWIFPVSYHSIGYYGLKNLILERWPWGTYNYALQATNSWSISFIKRTGTEWLIYYTFTWIPPMINRWVNISMTILNGIASLYVDGIFVGSKSIGTISPVANDYLRIGGTWTGMFAGNDISETLFSWSIDEVRIYNRALSDSEIQTLYSATK